MGSFRLVKWYLDLTTPDGLAAIAYWANLEWSVVSLRCASLVLAEPGREPVSRLSMHAGPGPSEQERGIEWSHAGLDFGGHWTPRTRAENLRLLDSEEGFVDWHCLAPAARVSLRIGAGSFEGLGYVERLEITLPPWKLPIDELRWGRAISPGSSLVWIDWRGPDPRSLVMFDGVRAETCRVGDTGVECPQARGVLHDPRVIRDGALGTTALAAVPGLSSWAPARLLAAVETKWVSRADLAPSGQPPSSGWAIHEVVRFTPTERGA